MPISLSARYQSEEMQIIAKNDEHEESMVNDPDFYSQMKERNREANAALNLTEAGDNAAQNGEVLVVNTNTEWINAQWRPAMGWLYLVVCAFDFILFPIGWSVLQAISDGEVTTQWQPLTLQGAGLFHLAMGAVLGVAVFGRTKEKLAGVA